VFLDKGGTARAPENALVCNMGGLALASPAGDVKFSNNNPNRRFDVSSVNSVPPCEVFYG